MRIAAVLLILDSRQGCAEDTPARPLVFGFSQGAAAALEMTGAKLLAPQFGGSTKTAADLSVSARIARA
jgi:predicted esterase